MNMVYESKEQFVEINKDLIEFLKNGCIIKCAHSIEDYIELKKDEFKLDKISYYLGNIRYSVRNIYKDEALKKASTSCFIYLFFENKFCKVWALNEKGI